MTPTPHDLLRLTRPPRRSGPRRWTAAVAAVAAAAVVAACGSSTTPSGGGSGGSVGSGGSAAPSSSNAAAKTKPAKVVSTGKGGVPLHVGDQAGDGAQALLTASGLLKKLPFKVDWADFTSGPPILQAMNAGSVDIAQVGDAPPVFALAGGANITIVGAVQNNPDSAALLVPKGSAIHSISQLKGKRIAVAQGSSADYHLLTVLKKAGLGVHDVTLEYLQPAEALAALSSGSVDAWDTWSPYIEQAVDQKGARVLVNGNGYGANFAYQVAARPALKDGTKSREIGEYLTLINRAHRWANAHPTAWARLWAQATGLPASVMVAAAKDDTSTPVPVTAQSASSEEGLVQAFSSAGLIPRSYSFTPYISTAFNSSVR